MNDYILVGKIVNFHGLNGKVKVISETNLKEKVFKVGNNLFIDENKYVINSYQVSGKYDLISFENYLNINLIEGLLGKEVYVKISNLNLSDNEYLYPELINLNVYENEEVVGKISDIFMGKNYAYIKVIGKKDFLIPLVSEYFVAFSRKEEKVYVKNTKNLII